NLVPEIQALQRRVSGAQLAQAYYVELMTYIALEDQAGACRTARLVKQLHSDSKVVDLANTVDRSCQ
ncbi:MAG: hypothetical protein OEW77_01810, partial [Gemmatimonadota bacterium]|nr:hypothetical protein [Gemmatimonadota bacterium]